MRVGFPHFGQSVLLVVSMTFLRSAVLRSLPLLSPNYERIIRSPCLVTRWNAELSRECGYDFDLREHSVKAGQESTGQREMHMSQAHALMERLRLQAGPMLGHSLLAG